jgi:hypothetical protein
MNERPNIRRLRTLEREEITGPFDPRRDILPSDWKNMEERLTKLRTPGFVEFTDFLRVRAQMGRLKEGSVSPLTVLEIDRVPAFLDAYEQQEDWGHYLWVAAAFRISEPSKPLLVLHEVKEGVHKLLEEDLYDDEGTYMPDRWSNMMQHAMEATLIMPDVRWLNFSDEEIRNTVIRTLEDVKTIEDMAGYLYMIGSLRVIRPDIQVEIPKNMWKLMHAELAALRQRGEWSFFTNHAFYMMLVAAEEVKLSKEKGLEITMRSKKHAEEVVPLPETLEL